jgi:hypothetical protein
MKSSWVKTALTVSYGGAMLCLVMNFKTLCPGVCKPVSVPASRPSHLIYPYNTSQTMVGATDTIFFATLTMVSVVEKMICVAQAVFSIPGTMVFSNEKIFRTAAIIFRIHQKMVSRFATIFCVSKTMVFDTRTKVEGTQKTF